MRIKHLFLLGLFTMSIYSVNGQDLKPIISKAKFQDTSEPLRDKTSAFHNDAVQKWKDGLVKNYLGYKDYINFDTKKTDKKSVQTTNSTKGTAIPIIDFDGTHNLSGVAPPDTDGDVGPNHYVQMVNSKLQIFDKNGTSLYGPVDNSTIWDGFNGSWTGTNDGDPIVLYDQQADRWFLSQFAVNTGDGTQWLLLAVSTTADPTGSYHRYAFQFTNMPDYPHFGIWPDGYYVSVNQFTTKKGTRAWAGAGVAAFERDEMLTGGTAKMVFFDMGTSYGNLLPADCDGVFPASGTPNYFTYFNDDAWGGIDELEVWKFNVDWANTANSTFTVMNSMPVSSFDSDINGSTVSYSRDNLSQPGTSQKLHAMTDRLMYRLQFRDFGTHQSMVACHTIDVGGERAGMRWYEMRRTSGNWSKYQEGTYAPADGDNRWMGSIAMNGNGDIALGYTVVGTSTYPSIRYTGRLASDPLNTMTITETEIIASTSSQTGVNRWGDYSCMSVDPTNDLTFWYTQEYTSGGWNWRTRIASFSLEDFGDPTISATAVSTTQIDLNWTKNVDGDDVMVVWSPNGTFGTPVDGNSYSAGNTISGGGTVLYVGAGTSYNHTALTSGTTYYYKAFSLTNSNPDYSPGVTTSAKTLKDAIFYDGFETDKGWTMNGEWERGAPQGLGGDYGNPDPSSAFNGSNILGLDLLGQGSYQGDYESSLADHAEYTISPVIDCSNYTDVEIEFQRWLGVESNTYDHAYIDISTNGGTSWTEIWANGSSTLNGGSWEETTYDISAYADGQATVQFRFSMGTSDGSWQFCGWNIDEFYVFGTPTGPIVPVATVSATSGCNTGSVTVSSNQSGTQTFYLRNNSGGALQDWTGDATSHDFTGLSNGNYRGQVMFGTETSALSSAVTLTNLTDPVAPTSVSATETSICSGTSTTLSYTGGSGTTFTWHEGVCLGGTVGTGNNVSVSPTTTTTYYGSWENTCGTSSCESVTITVNNEISANAGADQMVCTNTTTISANDPAPGVGTWTVMSGAATITDINSNNTTITITNSPVILRWTIVNGACSSYDDVTITMNLPVSVTTQPQSVNATVGDNVSFNVAADNVDTYQWQKDGSDISGATNNTYSISNVQTTDAGNYTVDLTGVCGTVSSDIAVLAVSVSIEDLSNYGINIYPNPSNGMFYIELAKSISKANVSILDMTGKLIYTNKLNSNLNEIDLSSQAKGIYFIKFNISDETLISKLILK